ncbi:MAG: oligosaccharide flippase family protein [Planctomycetota bacterium]
MTANPPSRPPLDALVSGPVEDDAEASAAAPVAGAGLRRRAFVGGLWTAVSFGGAQAIGFVSTLIMTRLLVKEDFGIMALVFIVIQGLQMFSEIGTVPALIQNKREDPAFYNTAWTIGVARGVVLWLIACLLAYPLSLLRDDWSPLAVLLPAAAFTCVFNGLKSTAWATASRRLNIRLIALIELGTNVARVLCMVAFAYFVSRSAWALVVGLLVASFIGCVVSHFMIRDIRNRFAFEREAFRELFSYGKWLFLGTFITFWAGQIDKLLMGAMLSTGLLGLFFIAARLADLGPMFFRKLGGWVGFPALSDLYRRDEARFRSRLLQLRIAVTAPINAGLLLMILLGPILTTVLYQPAYGESGWIVQIIAFGSLAGMVTTPYGNMYMATGRTKFNMLSVAAQLAAMLMGTVGGFFLARALGHPGEAGFLLGIGACQWLKYIADAAMAKRCGCWQWRFDAVALIGSGVLAYLAIAGSQWLAWRFVLS